MYLHYQGDILFTGQIIGDSFVLAIFRTEPILAFGGNKKGESLNQSTNHDDGTNVVMINSE